MKITRRDYRKGVGKDLPENQKESKQKGVSNYLKKKGKTTSELNKADRSYKKKVDLSEDMRESAPNPIDRQQEQMISDDEDKKGITNYIRNIFN